MKSAAYKDKELVISILSSSFETNKSVNAVVKQDAKRLTRIRSLMEYSFEICWRFGQVYLTQDERACALVLYPENKRTTLSSIYWHLQLVFSCVGITRVKNIMERESKIQANYPKELRYYIWFIGVDPTYQSKSIGSRLLQELLWEAQKMERIVCLETSVLSNVEWYQRRGFHVYQELDLGYQLFMMKK